MDISTPVVKKDHEVKMSGKAEYIADHPFPGEIWGTMVRSTVSFGKILDVKLPDLPEGYTAVTADDVPGENLLKVVTSEQPVFAGDTVRFLGEGILMITGPDLTEVKRLAAETEVTYEEYEPHGSGPD